jgi:hypothetical protein
MKLTFAAALLVLPLGGGLLFPQVIPNPGEPCTVLHAVSNDPSGRMMWCNHTMTTDPSTGQPWLVWQTGGPGD